MSIADNSILRYKVSGRLIIFMHLCAFIGIPILAYRSNNWWLLLGIPILYLGFRFGSKNFTIRIVIIAIVGFILLNYTNVIFSIFFLCFLFGFIIMRLYLKIGLGNNTSKEMIGMINPHIKDYN